MNSLNAPADFFDRLHGVEASGCLAVWTLRDKHTRAFQLGNASAVASAAAYCLERAADSDVYAGVCLLRHAPLGSGRGAESAVCAMPAVWADVDIKGVAHAVENLPETEEQALKLVSGIELRPSIIVRSGWGLQVYWTFKEPLLIETDADRHAAKMLSTRFQARLRGIAATYGWSLDTTADLARVLRVPGTFNRKIPGDIRLVTAEYFPYAYNPRELEEILEGVELPLTAAPAHSTSDLPPADLNRILNGCAWMRHCRDDAVTLGEPEWYRMLTVVARCQDAEAQAHRLSQPYPKYSRRETTAKLRQAGSSKVAPVTCDYVSSSLGGDRFCADCLFGGNIRSPVSIGRIDLEGIVLSPSEGDARGIPNDNRKNQAFDAAVAAVAGSPAERAGTVANDPVAELLEKAIETEKHTDLGNAKRFAARYRKQVHYCAVYGKWLFWDGKRWAEDRSLAVYDMAATLVREIGVLAGKIQDDEKCKALKAHARRSEAHGAISAMLKLAMADPRIAVVPEDLDRDPWLLNVNNGTVDLRTGKLKAHDPKDLITKLAPVTYDAGATCPNSVAFLDMILQGRRDVIAFVKRACGSCLTGITSDKAMFIMWGPGGDNGKSTMVDVIQTMLGDYGMRTPVETLLKRKEGAIPNDIARLKGARFVWAAESDRDARLSEALIKDLTGGDKISARFMRGEFFEYRPEFKLWIATNHKPELRGDPAIWNRLKLIPFHYTIPKDKQKQRHEVMQMFEAELSGILNWALEGCLEWQAHGLMVPEEVVLATDEYRAEQDSFAAFLADKCICAPNARTASSVLYDAYKQWAISAGETIVSHKMFASFLAERGFKKDKTNRCNIYQGIGLAVDGGIGDGGANGQRTGSVHRRESASGIAGSGAGELL